MGEYNLGMEKENPYQAIEKIASQVSYFTLQKTEDGWFMSFVEDGGEVQEIESEDLKSLIEDVSNLVFPSSSSDLPSAGESSAPPQSRNR
jgi:hypothetical protein